MHAPVMHGFPGHTFSCNTPSTSSSTPPASPQPDSPASPGPLPSPAEPTSLSLSRTNSATVPSAAPREPTQILHRTRSVTGRLPPPIDRLNLSAITASPIPHNYLTALRDPSWRHAMKEEFDALTHNQTWQLVPPPPGANIVSGKWVFRHKYNPDGSLSLAIKPVGSFACSLSNMVSISTRLLALSSNLLPFVLFFI